jgi:flagellar motor component MotA
VELLIIGGAATGAFSLSSTTRVFGMVLKSIPTVLMPKSPGKDKYLELLSQEHPGAHAVRPG